MQRAMRYRISFGVTLLLAFVTLNGARGEPVP